MANILDVLLDLGKEQRELLNGLTTKVDDGFAAQLAAQNAHEIADLRMFAAFDKRLVPLETMRGTLRWAIGVTFAAVVTVLADIIVHLANWKP